MLKTEIDWINTDERLPHVGVAILVLLPHMGLYQSHDWLEIRQVPDWMKCPGWRRS